MASERQIRRRIKSAKNIAQITRAMQMVSASKMKKAQAAAVSGRPYAEKIAEMVATFVARIEPERHPLLRQNPEGKTLVVLISTNKGLCGGLNTNLFRETTAYIKSQGAVTFVTLGNKGERYIVNGKRGELTADFSRGRSFVEQIPALTSFITQGFLKGEFKEVIVIYSNFISALRQEPTVKQLLPISNLLEKAQSENQNVSQEQLDFVVEPDMDTILDPLLVAYLENQLRDAVLEAEASEHSARMLAMKNATDNAKELIELLTLEYNKARQEKITYEIADMVTARLAVQ